MRREIRSRDGKRTWIGIEKGVALIIIDTTRPLANDIYLFKIPRVDNYVAVG